MENENENENENEISKSLQDPMNENENESENESEEEFLKDYASLRDGDTVIWQFSSDPSKRRRGPHDFGKGPTETMWFTITTAEDQDYEREWRVTSKKLMRALVNRYINRGKTLLELSRKGSRQDNTVYKIRAVDEDKIFVITNKEEYWEQTTPSSLSPQQKHLAQSA